MDPQYANTFGVVVLYTNILSHNWWADNTLFYNHLEGTTITITDLEVTVYHPDIPTQTDRHVAYLW